MLRRFAFVFLLGLGPIAGCKSCTNGDQGDGGLSPTTLLTDKQAQQVLAHVGNKDITLGDYTAALEHMDQFDRLRYQSPERRKELLDEMITVELLAQEATEKGYDKDPLSQQELRTVLRDAMLAEAKKGAPTPAEIPEADVRAWFDAHAAEYKDPERRRVSVVQTNSDASANDALAAAKKDRSAAAWGEVVRSKSLDPQARANVPVDLAGDLGITSPPDDPRGANPHIPQEVRVALYTLNELGDIYDKVVPAGGKFYVVRLTQKITPHERTYAEAERTIRVKLAQDELKKREDALIADLKKSIKVEVDESALATVRTDLTAPQDAGARDAGHDQ